MGFLSHNSLSKLTRRESLVFTSFRWSLVFEKRFPCCQWSNPLALIAQKDTDRQRGKGKWMDGWTEDEEQKRRKKIITKRESPFFFSNLSALSSYLCRAEDGCRPFSFFFVLVWDACRHSPKGWLHIVNVDVSSQASAIAHVLLIGRPCSLSSITHAVLHQSLWLLLPFFLFESSTSHQKIARAASQA